MQSIAMTYGSQTFKQSSGKVNVFVMNCDGSARKVFPDKVMHKTGSNTVHASISNTEVHGLWFPTNYTTEEASVIMVQASCTRGGKGWADGMTLLALRDDAPLIAVDVTLPANADAAVTPVRAFSGRADVLTLGELEEYGVKLYSSQVSKFFDAEEVDELFEIKTLQQGSARPKMATVPSDDGTVKRVRIQEGARRRIRIRRS